MDVKGKDKAS